MIDVSKLIRTKPSFQIREDKARDEVLDIVETVSEKLLKEYREIVSVSRESIGKGNWDSLSFDEKCMRVYNDSKNEYTDLIHWHNNFNPKAR